MAIDVTVSGLNTVVDVSLASQPEPIDVDGGSIVIVEDYDNLAHKPQINSVMLLGNKTSSDIGVADAVHMHTKSDITDFAHTHTKSQVTDFPTLATVATSGDYDDLIDKPAIHNVPSGGTSGQVLSKASATDYDLAWVNQSGGGASAFEAEFNVTTYADVKDAYDNDAILICTVDDSGNTMTLQLVYFDVANEIFFFAMPMSDGWYWTQLSNADGWDDGMWYFASTDVATQLADGLMSALDKQKLDTIASGAEVNVQSDWNQATNTADDYIKNKPTIPTITDTYDGTSSNGMSGKAVKSAIDALDGTISGSAGSDKTLTAFSQTDGKVSATFGNISITKSQVSDFPTIPTVNNATLTIQKNGTSVGTFTANASSNATANITVPVNISELYNDVPYSTVSCTRHVFSGTKIATLSIDGGSLELFAPTGGGGGTITDVTVDGTSVVSGTTAAIDLTGKADASHTHTKSQITDFPTNVSSFNNDSGYITGYTETDPIFTASAASGISSSDITAWNAKPAFGLGIPYGDCSTAGGTAQKEVSITGVTALTTGLTIAVKFTNANSVASPTLKVNTLTAKSIKRYGTTAPSTSTATSWNAGSVILLIYDGTYWQQVGFLNSTYSEISSANITNGSGSSTGLVSGRRAKSAVETFAPVKDVTVGGTSVMSGTTAVVPAIPTDTGDLTNGAGYITGYTETDPVFTASDAYGISSSDISNWNGKSDFSGDYTDLTNAPADYIVEQGTSGIWTYRKWNSGIAECWGEKSWTISSWTSWSSTYYSTYSGTIAYPSDLFIARPTVMADGRTSSGDAWLASRGGATYGGSKDETASYFFTRASNGTNNITGYVSIHAIGTWK